MLVIFVFSLGAKSLKSFSRHKLEEFCRRRSAEKRSEDIVKRHENVAATVSLAKTLSVVFFLICFIFFYLLSPSGAVPTEIRGIPALTIVVILVVFSEFWLPRALEKLLGTPVVYYGWFLWCSTATVLYPLLLVDRVTTLFFCRLAGHSEDKDEAFEEEIRVIVTEGQRDGLLEDEAREMIEGVIELHGVTVSEIMTPRTDMLCIADSLTWEEMLRSVATSSHSRIPVYKETRDDIVGVIHTKNLLRELALTPSEQRRPWTEIMSEPLFVPETKPVDTLLQEFQNVQLAGSDETNEQVRGHLAIVLDEYGGVAGIVTLEDILEEIVGEITDEHDAVITTESVVKLSPDVFEVQGKVRIDDLNSQLGLALPEEEDYDTVAGFIFSTLGHIPEEGEFVDFDHDGKKVRLTVIAVTRRRIEKVQLDRNC